jgi:hypothetical protein
MQRVDCRALVLLLGLAAVWWPLTLARGCGRPRPLELVAAEQRGPVP